MYPVIDIPPSSPSLKRTQREANFLSRKDFSPEPNDQEDRRQHIAVGQELDDGRGRFCEAFSMYGKERRRTGRAEKNRSFCSAAGATLFRQTNSANRQTGKQANRANTRDSANIHGFVAMRKRNSKHQQALIQQYSRHQSIMPQQTPSPSPAHSPNRFRAHIDLHVPPPPAAVNPSAMPIIPPTMTTAMTTSRANRVPRLSCRHQAQRCLFSHSLDWRGRCGSGLPSWG